MLEEAVKEVEDGEVVFLRQLGGETLPMAYKRAVVDSEGMMGKGRRTGLKSAGKLELQI